MNRLALAVCVFTSSQAVAQPLGPAELALEVEAAWASARLTGAARTMASRDLFSVSPSGQVSGYDEVDGMPDPGYWDDDCVGWTYGSTVVVRCTQEESGGGPLREGVTVSRALRVFVKEGVDWKAVLNHSVWIRGVPPHIADSAGAARVSRASSAVTTNAMDRGLLTVQAALTAAVASQDAATCDRHTSPEFVLIDPDGGLSFRAAFLRSVAAPRGRIPAVPDDTRVRVFGQLATISWTDALPAGRSGAGRPVRTTRLFAKTNGAWLQVAAIATAVQADAGRP